MAFDNTLWLTGSTDAPTEDVSATGNGTGKDWGANRMFFVELAVGGAAAGTSPTLDIKLQDSPDNVTFTDRVSFAQVTANPSTPTAPQQGYQTAGGVIRPEVPRSSSAAAAPQKVALYTQARYVRCVKTIGGTGNPSFAAVSVVGFPRIARG